MPQIPQSVINELIAHAREDLPNEACGMVHAKDGTLTVHRVKNAAASPYRYEMDPLQMMRLERTRDDEGEALFAIYHSHVASQAYPSPTDIRMAFFPPGEVDQPPMFPGTLYILVSLEHEEPSVRAFHVRQGGHVDEEPIEVA